MNLQWDRIPSWRDPRIPFLAILTCYVVLGITVLGFNRSPAQIIITVGAACLLDMGLHYLLREKRLLFPLSAAISGIGLSILMNYAHGLWLPLVPVFFAIASKYALTFNGRHIFNPTLFAVVICLKFADGMFSAAPAYQWGGSAAMAAFVVTAALVLFVFRIGRSALILSFLLFYFLELALRAWLTRWHVPPETLFMGAMTSPAFYLFTFFMITDPQTSPQGKWQQIGMSFCIVLIDLVLHQYESLSTLFLAGFAYFSGRLIWLHAHALWQRILFLQRLVYGLKRWATLGLIGWGGWLSYQQLVAAHDQITPNFKLVEIATTTKDISAQAGDVLERVDPRIAHVGKWVLSVGDAVVVADVDNDGLQDLFFTFPLKHAQDRAALYRNLGHNRFARVPLPALADLVRHPETEGLPTGAIGFDYDNDGDQDLLLLVSFGRSRVLQNRWKEEGALRFFDVTQQVGINEYTASVAANVLDINQDGKIDMIICNAINPLLPGYSEPTRFNVFKLPQAQYVGDRRMFNFMHQTWHNAKNGGGCVVYMNTGSGFQKLDAAKIGLGSRYWTLAIGTGDLNGDGWTDLYLANDFGPDQMLINHEGKFFAEIRSGLVGELGHDTYKGMNASLGDLDNNGYLDIYVSNVHEKLQAEGSLMWMNDGTVARRGAAAFSDQAMARNALNEKRFGWGAALGDLDRDGRLDIVQANGMVDDSYDKRYPVCPDYWYWNDKIALTGPEVHGYADRWADLRGRCIFPKELNRVFLNQGKYFIDVAEQAGLDTPGNARAVAMADLDNDGALDVLITRQFAPPSLYHNEAQEKSWLGLDLQGNGVSCNRNALGTKVLIRYGEQTTQWREVTAVNGFSAQGDRRLLFGLDGYHGNVTVEIYWCGNKIPEVTQMHPGRYYRVAQNR